MPSSYLYQCLLELLVLFLSVYLGVWLRFRGDLSAAQDAGPILLNSLLLALIVTSSMAVMGLYHRHARDGFGGILFRLVVSFAVSFLIMSSIYYFFPDAILGRGALALSFVVAVVGIGALRLGFYFLLGNESFKRRILVLGAGEKAKAIENTFRRKVDRHGFTIAAFIRMPDESSMIRETVIEYDRPLIDMAKQFNVDEILVAMDERRDHMPMRELIDCRMAGIEIIELSSFFERQAGKVMLSQLYPSWLAFSEGFRVGRDVFIAKRLFDVVVSTLLLLVAWPLMLLTVLAIVLESRGTGGVLYRQIRVGQYGEDFNVLKFRSMITSSEKDGVARWAKENDSRITLVGKFIRAFRIDELPQLFNVLKGDMSFVGPRPERPEFVDQLSKSIAYYSERHRVKPGITGWAQICYPYGASEKDSIEKLQYDLYYIKNYSLFLDLTIIFQTAQAVLWHKGAR